MLQSTQEDMINALKGITVIFLGVKEKPAETAKMLVDLALKARKEGILALQNDIVQIEDPFLKKGLELMTDGTDPQLLRDLLETELGFYEEKSPMLPKYGKEQAVLLPPSGLLVRYWV